MFFLFFIRLSRYRGASMRRTVPSLPGRRDPEAPSPRSCFHSNSNSCLRARTTCPRALIAKYRFYPPG